MIFLISDLHIDPQRPAITQAFYHFLENIAHKAEALYILGDFFEVWLGDDDDTPIYQEVIEKLTQYGKQGTRIYFMRGNRDFLVGIDFAKRTGATLLNDPTTISYRQQSLLLMHGDSLCTQDIDYIQFRTMARSAKWQHELLAKPLAERRLFAEQVRQKSKTMNSLKAEDIMDVTPKEVTKIMSNFNVHTLIHGHTHRPATHALTVNNKEAKRIVLGDWHTDGDTTTGWYICVDNQQISLEQFNV